MVTDDQDKGQAGPREPAVVDTALRHTIQRAKAGEAAAFHSLYELYSDTVFATIMRIVRDPHEAEDVTQQVFAKLMVCIGQYEERSQPFVHWLTRVCRNAALDHLRRRRPVPVEHSELVAEARSDGSELIDSLKRALGTLSAEQREVVLMRHLVGLSPDEIAVRTGRTTASVNGLHFRARRQLRRELTSQGVAPATCSRAA